MVVMQGILRFMQTVHEETAQDGHRCAGLHCDDFEHLAKGCSACALLINCLMLAMHGW